eukprot:scaffold54828_cov30-Tisochrysis_lutea.AAC.5
MSLRRSKNIGACTSAEHEDASTREVTPHFDSMNRAKVVSTIRKSPESPGYPLPAECHGSPTGIPSAMPRSCPKRYRALCVAVASHAHLSTLDGRPMHCSTDAPEARHSSLQSPFDKLRPRKSAPCTTTRFAGEARRGPAACQCMPALKSATRRSMNVIESYVVEPKTAMVQMR